MIFCRFICLVLLFVLHIGLARRVRRGFCSTRGLQIQNGDYSIRNANSMAVFTCNEGFILYGSAQLLCLGTKWTSDPPICVSNACPDLPFIEGLRIEKTYNGSILHLSCEVMFRLEGPERLICDGRNWSAHFPTCQPWVPPMKCDFELPAICSWSHHHDNDVDWQRHTGSTRTSRTGPSHDHTLGEGGNGHYMYFETSSPVRPNNVARLQSPLYLPEFSLHYCFQFWYHFLTDEDDDGWFEVLFVPDGKDWTEVTPAFSLNSSQGDVWKMHEIRLEDMKKPFTINFVGMKGTGYRSDFAFDDVKLYRCVGTSPVSHHTTLTRTPSSRRQTPTTLPVSSPSTRQPTSTPTTPPQTTRTPISTTRQTPSPTTIPVSSQSTSRSTLTPPPTTNLSTRTINITRPVTSGISVSFATTAGYNKNERMMSPDGDGLSAAAYVGIFIGVLIVVIATATLGYVWYRRRRKMEDLSFSANNPCYIAANGDDPKVCFADDDDPYNTIDD